MKAIPLILTALFLMSNGCKKGNSEVLQSEATIRDWGSPASDGCGWMIRVGESFYSPAKLDEKYQVNNHEVILEYELTGEKYSCGFPTSTYYEIIRIKSIKTK